MPMCLGDEYWAEPPTEPLQAVGDHAVKHRWIPWDGGAALQIIDEASTIRAKHQISGLAAQRIL